MTRSTARQKINRTAKRRTHGTRSGMAIPPASASEQSQASFSSRSPGFGFTTSRKFRQKPMSRLHQDQSKPPAEGAAPALRISKKQLSYIRKIREKRLAIMATSTTSTSTPTAAATSTATATNGNGCASSRSSSRASKPGRGPSQPMGSFHHPPLLRWFIPSSATPPSACRLSTRLGHGFTRSGTSDRCAPGLP